MYTARALRRFKPDPVPDDVLFQLMDAAIRAPSGQNAQDWRFICVRDQVVKDQMHEWAQTPWRRYQARYAEDPEQIDTLPRSQRLSLRSVEHLVQHFRDTPVVVVACGLKGRHSTPGGSIFPAIQNLLLAARGLGLSGSVSTFPSPMNKHFWSSWESQTPTTCFAYSRLVIPVINTDQYVANR